MIPIAASLRQFLYPREFRIPEADSTRGLEGLIRRAAEILEKEAEHSPDPVPTRADEDEQRRLVAGIATGLWRLRQKMVKLGSREPAEDMSRAVRHLESLWDTLSQAGTEIIDHSGESFSPGSSLRVLAFQPVTGIDRDRVIETIKPTIVFKGQTVQIGEVVVGTPATEEGARAQEGNNG
jgi:hypothetical protein